MNVNHQFIISTIINHSHWICIKDKKRQVNNQNKLIEHIKSEDPLSSKYNGYFRSHENYDFVKDHFM